MMCLIELPVDFAEEGGDVRDLPSSASSWLGPWVSFSRSAFLLAGVILLFVLAPGAAVVLGIRVQRDVIYYLGGCGDLGP